MPDDDVQLLDRLRLLSDSIVETIFDQTADEPASAATVATFVTAKVCVVLMKACNKSLDETLTHAKSQLETAIRILAEGAPE
jgi:hypothetical protein